MWKLLKLMLFNVSASYFFGGDPGEPMQGSGAHVHFEFLF